MIYQLLADLTKVSPGALPKTPSGPGTVHTVFSILFGIIGALALLMITISGLRYITSGGDPQKAASAKNGIITALVGLAIAVAAQGIVAYVARQL